MLSRAGLLVLAGAAFCGRTGLVLASAKPSLAAAAPGGGAAHLALANFRLAESNPIG